MLKVDDHKTLAVQFRSAADAFRLIDDKESSHGGGALRRTKRSIDKLLATRLAAEGPQRWLMRKLQRYTVTIRQSAWPTRCWRKASLTLPMPGLYMQLDKHRDRACRLMPLAIRFKEKRGASRPPFYLCTVISTSRKG
jgi:CRISPR-associated endonuclease/helicase Cas3